MHYSPVFTWKLFPSDYDMICYVWPLTFTYISMHLSITTTKCSSLPLTLSINLSLAIFTLQDEQIVTGRTNHLRRTNHLMCKQDKQIFQQGNCLIFGHTERQFFLEDLPVMMNKLTTVRHKLTSDGQMPDNLFIL